MIKPFFVPKTLDLQIDY